MKELFDWISDNSHKSMYDGKLFSTELSITDILRKAESMLDKEKEVMQDFATDYERECRINLERGIEKCWDETFNTKDDTSKGIN